MAAFQTAADGAERVSDLVRLEIAGETAVLTLLPAGRFPVLSLPVLRALEAHLAALPQRFVRSVVLCGEGGNFAAGADIRELMSMQQAEAYEFAVQGQRVCRLLEHGPFVSIAAASGIALGGGTEILLACDVRFCDSTARFGETGVTLGIMAGWGGTRRLPRLVGEAAARDLLLSGRHFGSDEAARIGLVAGVVEGDVRARALEYASLVNQKAPLSIRATKAAMRRAEDDSEDEREARLFAGLFASRDTREGFAAFLERRNPEFKAE